MKAQPPCTCALLYISVPQPDEPDHSGLSGPMVELLGSGSCSNK